LVTPLRATNRKAAYGSPLSRVAKKSANIRVGNVSIAGHFLRRPPAVSLPERTLTARLAKTEERKDYAYHDNQADYIDDSIHDTSPMNALT
jgi:hypothetical protein